MMLDTNFDDMYIPDDVWNKFEFLDFPGLLPDLEDPFPDLTDACFAESPQEVKPQIMHHDCMWSGRCIDKSHTGKCTSSNVQTEKVEPITTSIVEVKKECISTTTAVKSNQNKSYSVIAPGRSLLLNSRYPQQTTKLEPKLLPLNQGFRELNLLQALKHATSSVPNMKIFPQRPTPPDSSSESEETQHLLQDIGSMKHSSSSVLHNPSSLLHNSSSLMKNPSSSLKNSSSMVNSSSLMKSSSSLMDLPFSDDDDSDDKGSDDGSDDGSDEDYEDIVVKKPAASSMKMNRVVDVTADDGDHCYSLSKERIESLGVQTPSDSEEEIDVVSIGDKTLPTNPSIRDRRHLQSTVARKISESRIVKQPGGLKTLPPRRPVSPEYQKPQKNPQNQTQTSRKRRRRSSTSDDDFDFDLSYSVQKPKKRGRKRRSQDGSQSSSSSWAMGNQGGVEKRSQHNDMERQRRIGLKNLFEQLKAQVPSIREKDRAPKVTILREAAALCRQLEKQQNTERALRYEQQRLLQKVKTLRMELATGRISE